MDGEEKQEEQAGGAIGRQEARESRPSPTRPSPHSRATHHGPLPEVAQPILRRSLHPTAVEGVGWRGLVQICLLAHDRMPGGRSCTLETRKTSMRALETSQRQKTVFCGSFYELVRVPEDPKEFADDQLGAVRRPAGPCGTRTSKSASSPCKIPRPAC